MLIARIFMGPDRRPHWSDEDYPSFRSQLTARYGKYLELKGCLFNAEHHQRLDEIIQGIPDWSDGWATSTVTERGSRVGYVGIDETPDQIKDLPIDKIVPVAKEELRREFGSFTEKRPFTGLVKSHPRRALSALTIAARENDYPKALWASMINDLPKDVSPRMQRLFLRRITRLPHEVIVELRHTLCRWLEQNLSDVLVLDDDLGWAVFDHIVDGTISGGSEAAESGMGEVRLAGEVIERSRRTLDHAINGPLGMCAEALFNAVPGETQEKGSLVPDHIKTRLERLFAAPGEGSDHAVAVACQRLNWFMFIDPEWTKCRLIPLLAFEHPAAEPAWNGFLHSGRVPIAQLTELINPLLISIFPWIEGFSWDRDLTRIAAEWLGWMRIFQPDEAAGCKPPPGTAFLR